ncbi:uncharacterized protein (TIGR02600 family) [Roseimicrobium gellanilyticum]|uniref:Uncharacterized protein (TIGR02600 family) n=1 Tax=Roseimicrobium gellanilyticum TaxID=748857 RepID=A0A366H7E3_9BACT|nr:Verru_Chthon cassette protein A [Roseimicrobium gellanilyticum]RBP38080.1 uncharacterized protein (TIGR02600 family) [Roseimicrobium gellanilyticum]
MNPRPSGIVLVPVLLIIALTTIIVVMFFSLSNQQYLASTSQAAAQDVGSLRDVAVNIAIGQLRHGTTEQNAVWISQPGAVRTYTANEGTPSRIYKLYSASNMISGAQGLTAAGQNLEDDMPTNWKSMPEVYADLNDPAIRDNGEVSFPILDPRAMDSAVPVYPGSKTPEGFRYSNSLAVSQANVSGVHLAGTGSPQDQRLPMPVRWIYVLANGTYGVLDPETKRFVPFQNQGVASMPGPGNPISGRVAFWTDDESSKVNINTASEGIYWDTPRAATPEDVEYAQKSPVRNEVQRFGGHPASTSLSSIFLPGQRLDPTTPDGRTKLQQIYEMTPRVNMRSQNTPAAPLTGILGGQPNPVAYDKDRLYASVDEFLMQAPGNIPAAERTVQPLFADDPARLARLRFFLTAESRAPETTARGTPRMSIWPTSWDPDTTSKRYTSFDRLNIFAATLGGKAYFYRRYASPYSALTEYGSDSSTGTNLNILKGNATLSRYLYALSKETGQGYAASMDDKYGRRNMAVGIFSMLEYIRQTNIHDTTRSTTGEQVLSYDGSLWGTTNLGGSETHGQIINVATSALPQPLSGYLEEDPLIRANALNRIYTLSEFGLVFSLAAEHKQDGTKYNAALSNQLNLPKGYKAIQVGTVFEGFCPSQGYAMIGPNGGMLVENLTTLRITTSATTGTGRLPGGQVTGTAPGYAQAAFNKWGRWNHTYPHMSYMTALPATGQAAKLSQAGWWVGWGGSGGRHMFVDATSPASINANAGYADNVAKIGLDNFYQADFESPTRAYGNQYSRGFFLVPSEDTRMTLGPSGTVLRVYSGYTRYGPAHSRIRHHVAIPAGMTVPVPTEPINRAATWGARVQAATANRGLNPEIIDPADTVRTWVVRHGDNRLVSLREYEKSYDATQSLFTPHPDWNPGEPNAASAMNKRQIHSFTKSGGEWERQQHGDPRDTSGGAAPVDARPARGLVAGVAYTQSSQPDFSRSPDSPQFFPGKPGGYTYSVDPSETRDWDNGTGIAPDGAYWNRPDDVAQQADGNIPPYFTSRPWDGVTSKEVNQTSAPNQMIPSAVMFGSISSGAVTGLPWTTYLFRPNMSNTSHLGEKGKSISGAMPGAPPDHAILDWFWMPVLQPYAISEPFSTAGKINMNYRIVPFTHIKRATGLHALMKSERLLAIPTTAGATYKEYNSASGNAGWRRRINVDQTLFQWEERFNAGQFFKSAGEICEQFLVPEGTNISATSISSLNTQMRAFWNEHRLSGDNTLERPYANLYPRLTTRSNTFRVHYLVQSIRKARSGEPTTFDPEKDVVTGESQGDALIERAIDPNDPELSTPDYDFLGKADSGTLPTAKSLDTLYTWRIRNIRNFRR